MRSGPAAKSTKRPVWCLALPMPRSRSRRAKSSSSWDYRAPANPRCCAPSTALPRWCAAVSASRPIRAMSIPIGHRPRRCATFAPAPYPWSFSSSDSCPGAMLPIMSASGWSFPAYGRPSARSALPNSSNSSISPTGPSARWASFPAACSSVWVLPALLRPARRSF